MKILFFHSTQSLFAFLALFLISGCANPFGGSEVVGRFFQTDLFPQAVSFSGPREIAALACTEYSLAIARDDGKTPNVEMTFVPQGETLPPLFSDSSCEESMRSLVVPANSSEMKFYVKGTAAGAWSVLFLMEGNSEVAATWTATFTSITTTAPEEVTLALGSISPTSGPVAGGTTLTLTGQGFDAGASVSVGGSSCTNIQVLSTTQLTCESPAHASGAVSISLTVGSRGTATLTSAYTYYLTPSFSSISPSTGPLAGGQTVVVSGSEFGVGMTVLIGGVSCPGSRSANTFTCVTPASATAGATTVEIQLDGRGDTAVAAYSYKALPSISDVSPGAGPTSGGTAITLTGTGFDASSTVSVSGNSWSCSYVSATRMDCQTPASAEGTVSFVVTDAYGQTGEASNAFAFRAPPTISSVTPLTAPVAGGSEVTFTGSGFSSPSVTLAGVTCPLSSHNSTQIVCTAASGSVGSGAIVVTNSDGQSATYSSAFTYTPAQPTLSSISPTSGPYTGSRNVTLTGTGFFADGLEVQIGGVSLTNVAFVNATTITGTTPPLSAGSHDVTVSNSGSDFNYTSTLTSGFAAHAAPNVVSVSPDFGSALGGTTITINVSEGIYDESISVTVGGASCGSVVVGLSSLTCVTEASASGAADVVVLNGTDGLSGTLTNGFTYRDAPTITSVLPANGPIAGSTTITIEGSGFAEEATVDIGGAAATSVTVLSSSLITAVTPSHAAGWVDVAVNNPGGIAGTALNVFEYQGPPNLESISPSAVNHWQNVSVEFTGTGFQPGATVSDALCLNLVYNSPTSMTCTTISVHYGIPWTPLVQLTNPDGQRGTGVYLSFSYPPSASSLSPSGGGVNGGTSLVISGSYLDSVTSVTVGGEPCTALTISSNSVSCTTPALSGAPSPNSEGVYSSVSVVVMDAAGRTSELSGAFTYADAPVVSSVSPDYVPTGLAAVSITGSNFRNPFTVNVGSSCSLVSSTSISCSLSESSPGSMNVTVTNPDGQAGTLESAFEVYGAASISSLDRSVLPLSGGEIEITGTNFSSDLSATFDSFSESVTVDSRTVARVSLPAKEAGTYNLSIANGVGGAGTNITYRSPPTISSVSPERLHVTGGMPLTISGSGLDEVTSAVLNDVNCPITSQSSTSIVCTVPAYSGPENEVFTSIALTDSLEQTVTSAVTYALSDVWAPMSTTGAPQTFQTVPPVWTGSQMVVWQGGSAPNNGGRYNRTENTWSSISTENAPSYRFGHAMAWNGTHVVVFGGKDPNTWSALGGTWLYNPATDAWSTVTAECPLSARAWPIVVAAGDKVIFWGGKDENENLLSGGAILNADGTWTAMADGEGSPPAMYGATGTWTGSEFVLWGRDSSNNLAYYRYDMNSTWSTPTLNNAPEGNYLHSATLIGNSIYFFGGHRGGQSLDTLGVLNAAGTEWTNVSATPPTLTARHNHTSATNGTKLFVWGGEFNITTAVGIYSNGSIYDPVANTWSPMAAGGPENMTSVYSIMVPDGEGGGEWLFWGFNNLTYLGARYFLP